MFREGEIILFTPFYFKNGNTAKDKYFIILKIIDGDMILASLPTSVNKAPSIINLTHGCVNHDDRCFNCYLFESGKSICTNGFSFGLPTFVYGNEVEDYNISILSSVYGIEGIDFIRVGVLIDAEFYSLIACIKESGSIRKRIKRLL